MFDIFTVLKENPGAATVIAAILTIFGGVVAAIINTILHKSKLKKEQKVGYQTMIGEEIANALKEMLDLTQIALSTKSVFSFKENGESINMMDGISLSCPEILDNAEMFHTYRQRVHDAIARFDAYLDCETAAYIIYMEGYLTQLAIYLDKSNFDLEKEELLGALLCNDITDWAHQYKTVLIKKINRPKYKLENHEGRKWESVSQRIYGNFWGTSKLLELIKNYDTDQLKN